MPIPRIIHRIWIGPALTDLQFSNLLEARQDVQGKVELWLWTNQPAIPRSLHRNIVIRKLESLWVECMNLPFSLFGLRSAFERECYGTMYHNYASASDIARLLILYRYGGVYLDMDVYFKEYLFDLFGDLDNIGSRLGVLIGRYKWGNGVLAAMPRALALEKCLAEIVKSYTKKETKKNGRLTWYLKRLYGDDRINLTTEITGPLMILKTLGYEGLLLKIQRARYFEHIDASGTAYKERPELPLYLPRRDSLS